MVARRSLSRELFKDTKSHYSHPRVQCNLYIMHHYRICILNIINSTRHATHPIPYIFCTVHPFRFQRKIQKFEVVAVLLMGITGEK
jgi:hypothetical protein